jgi:hypothetical protein
MTSVSYASLHELFAHMFLHCHLIMNNYGPKQDEHNNHSKLTHTKQERVGGEGRRSQLSVMLLCNFNVQHVSAYIQKAIILQKM